MIGYCFGAVRINRAGELDLTTQEILPNRILKIIEAVVHEDGAFVWVDYRLLAHSHLLRVINSIIARNLMTRQPISVIMTIVRCFTLFILRRENMLALLVGCLVERVVVIEDHVAGWLLHVVFHLAVTILLH